MCTIRPSSTWCRQAYRFLSVFPLFLIFFFKLHLHTLDNWVPKRFPALATLANIAWSEWDAVTFNTWCWSPHSDRQKFVSLIFACEVSSVKRRAWLWAKIIFACEVNPVKWHGWMCAKIILACEVNSVKYHVWFCAFSFSRHCICCNSVSKFLGN